MRRTAEVFKGRKRALLSVDILRLIIQIFEYYAFVYVQ
jgi:hypothetical protein